MQRTDFAQVLKVLQKHKVEFIIVGGVSAVLHGAPVNTFDLDIIHHRTTQNVSNLAKALEELNAHYRTRRELHIEPSQNALLGQGHHLLLTDCGALDVLGIVGNLENPQNYQDLLEDAEPFQIGEDTYQVQGLQSLIHTKKVVGREKDLAALPVLENTLREKEKAQDVEDAAESSPK